MLVTIVAHDRIERDLFADDFDRLLTFLVAKDFDHHLRFNRAPQSIADVTQRQLANILTVNRNDLIAGQHAGSQRGGSNQWSDYPHRLAFFGLLDKNPHPGELLRQKIFELLERLRRNKLRVLI